MTATRSRRAGDPDRLAELEDERRFLLRSLTDLDRERAADDIDEDDYRTLRDGYTARAADVLRAIEQGRAALPPKAPRHPGRLAAAWGSIGLVAIGLGVVVAWASGDRGPDDSATGGISDSVAATLSRARRAEAAEPIDAIDLYNEVLAQDPDNAEALTYLGWLEIRVGADTGAADLVDTGQANLDRAIEVAPSYADPWCFTAIVRFRARRDAPGAKEALDRCTAADPPQSVVGLLAGLRAEIDAALAAGPPSSVASSVPTNVPDPETTAP